MKSFAIAAITLALAGLGHAGVAHEARQDPSAAASTTLLLCKNQNFGGKCVTHTVPDNACCRTLALPCSMPSAVWLT